MLFLLVDFDQNFDLDWPWKLFERNQNCLLAQTFVVAYLLQMGLFGCLGKFAVEIVLPFLAESGLETFFIAPFVRAQLLVNACPIIVNEFYIKQPLAKLKIEQQKLMTDTEALRQSILQQSDDFGTKKRFGLFSQPISTAVGDNGPYMKKLHPRDPSTKKPVTMPRNFFTSPTKSGQGDKHYFGPLLPLASSHVKDEYIEPGKRMLKEQKEKRQKDKHQVSFFTGAGTKILSKSAYEYVQDKKPQLDPKRNRDQDGKVKAEPRNLYSNPQSKVELSLYKPYEHMEDPYDRAAKLERERNKRNKSMEGQARFKPNSFSPKPFNTEKQIFGEDVQLKKKQPLPEKLNIYKHENPWKSSSPNKHGIYGFLAPFPEYKQNPSPQVKRQPTKQKTKDSFKLCNPQTLTTPSCSITLHRTNIRRSLGH